MIRVAGIQFSYYPLEPRARREAEALVEAGMQVDTVCLRKDGEKAQENVNGVQVYRLPLQKNRSSKLNYIAQYLLFLVLCFMKLSWLHLRNRYDMVIVHNMPDILVLSALVPKMTGSKVMLDLHDPVPEIFMTKYCVDQSHPVVRLLAFIETCCIRFCDIVITPNISFRNLFVSRGCPEGKICIVMNSPIERIFSCCREQPRPVTRKDPESFVIMFHGSIFERHGVDTAVEAMAQLKQEISQLQFKVFGDGDYLKEFLQLIEAHDLGDVVKYRGLVPLEQIAKEIQDSDIGIITNKRNPFTDVNFPTRIFEYLSLGKAVVAPMTQGILDYFDDKSIFYFEPGDPQSLCNAILRIYRGREKLGDVVARGQQICYENRWELQKKALVEQITSMVH